MVKPDWLSIEEIARLWSEETGADAAAFEKDLEAWFADFIKQAPASAELIEGEGEAADNANRLMGMLGARYLERSTFETYCQERGYPEPQFWTRGRASAPRQAKPAPQSAPESAPGSQPAAPQGDDPELTAFQSQIAQLSQNLETPRIALPPEPEFEEEEELEPDDDPAAAPLAGPNEQELMERAEAEQLRAQLDEAARQIQALTAAAQAKEQPRDQAPSGAAPNFLGYGATSGAQPPAAGAANYRDPDAVGAMLRQAAEPPKRRAGPYLTAGLTVAFFALLVWGGTTAIDFAYKTPNPPEELAADGVNGSDPGENGTSEIQAARLTSETSPQMDPAVQSQGRTVGRRGTQGAASASPEIPPAAPSVTSVAQTPAGTATTATATPSSASATMDPWLMEKDLLSAQSEIARLAAKATESDAMIARLHNELAVARRDIEAARQAAAEAAETDAAESEAAAAEAAELEEEAAKAIFTARAESDRLRQENGRLTDQLANANAGTEELRVALRQAEEREAALRDQSLAATVSSARLADLNRDLETARERAQASDENLAAAREEVETLTRGKSEAESEVANLQVALAQAETEAQAQAESDRQALARASEATGIAEAQIAELEDELSAAREEIAALAATIEEIESAEVSAAPAPVPAAPEAAEVAEATPEIGTEIGTESGTGVGEEAAPETAVDTTVESIPEAETAELSPLVLTDAVLGAVPESDATSDAEAANDEPSQLAALETGTDAGPATAPEVVPPETLLSEPNSLLGQEVEVTGPVVWLLWRYRLQSELGPNSIVLDVEGLTSEIQEALRAAIDEAGPVGKVQARILGRIERHGATGYRLAASELELPE